MGCLVLPPCGLAMPQFVLPLCTIGGARLAERAAGKVPYRPSPRTLGLKECATLRRFVLVGFVVFEPLNGGWGISQEGHEVGSHSVTAVAGVARPPC